MKTAYTTRDSRAGDDALTMRYGFRGGPARQGSPPLIHANTARPVCPSSAGLRPSRVSARTGQVVTGARTELEAGFARPQAVLPAILAPSWHNASYHAIGVTASA